MKPIRKYRWDKYEKIVVEIKEDTLMEDGEREYYLKSDVMERVKALKDKIWEEKCLAEDASEMAFGIEEKIIHQRYARAMLTAFNNIKEYFPEEDEDD